MIRVGVNRVCASSNSGEDFFEGPRNDVVQVFVDDTLVHTGTSWEDFFRYCEATDTSRTVDSLLLQARTSGGTAPGTSGYGFLVDNLDLESGPAPCPSTPQSGCQPAESRRAQLFLRNGTLKWRWISSADVATADFGDPTTMSPLRPVHLRRLEPDYERAGAGRRDVWHETVLEDVEARGRFQVRRKGRHAPRTQEIVPPGRLCREGADSGESAEGSSRRPSNAALATPVRVQLEWSGSSVCWEATYSSPSRNDATQFKAKSD